MNLFQTGFYKLHSGISSNFKIDADALTDEDINTIALQLVLRLPAFATVEGIPQGGLRLAEALKQYVVPFQPVRSDKHLIVDDVFTTGGSMEKAKSVSTRYSIIGAVIFARSDTPSWITPLFRLEP